MALISQIMSLWSVHWNRVDTSRLDAMAMPYMEGPLDINLVVSYTDDFNQPRVVEQILSVQVEPMPVFEEIPGEGSIFRLQFSNSRKH